jgi:hypothetical protein
MEDDLAFLHTATVHIDTFSALAAEIAPHLRVRHVVAEELLALARRDGLTAELGERVQSAMREAASTGASVVVCTCSTVGGVAETAAGGLQAMRIDRPMADRAVTLGRRILVVAALESTLGPTVDLLADSATRSGAAVQLSTLLVADAWSAFEAGDTAAYTGAIEEAIRLKAHQFDVLVLAQASMASAGERCADLGVPVLSSPRPGVAAAVRMLSVARSP